jgi:hypothetical protein
MEMAKEEGPILHSRFRQYPKEDFNIICGEWRWRIIWSLGLRLH